MISPKTKPLKFKSKNHNQISKQIFMKKIITSLCLGFMLTFAAFSNSGAAVIPGGTYYVISGESFSLTPAVSSLFQYKWLLNPGANQIPIDLAAATGGVFTRTFGTGNETEVVKNVLQLGVLSEAAGCLSDIIEHTIIVLPKIKVTLTVPEGQDNFCLNQVINTNLTANITAMTGLGDYGVTISPSFLWKKGNDEITGQTGSVLAITSAGTYSALTSYVLPTSGTWAPTASKLLNSVNSLSKEIKNDLPLPVVPTITLN